MKLLRSSANSFARLPRFVRAIVCSTKAKMRLCLRCLPPRFAALCLLLVSVVCAADQAKVFAQVNNPAYKILVFTKTTGFRHDSIPAAITMIRGLGEQNGFQVDATEDAAAFNPANLEQYRAVVFLLTTGEILNNEQQTAFESFVRAGKGWVGVHSASDTEYGWAWYGGLVGAYFGGHPEIQTATVRVENPNHPSSAMLPANWTRTDEWYNFQTNPRARVTVLANLDEATYSGGNMGDHPIAWFHSYDGGRAWYTGGGHTTESYSEPLFRQHILGGIHYAVNPPPPLSEIGALGGLVTTRNNAGVAGARVILRSATTGETRFAVTSAGGRFAFKNLRHNDLYVVSASRKKFNFIEPQQTVQLLRDRDNLVFAANNR